MLKQILFSLSLCLLLTKAQTQTAAAWQSDLHYMQQTIHSKYSNLFYNITAADWDKQVDELDRKIPSMDQDQVLAGFIQLIALFHIGHTQVNTFNQHSSGASPLHRSIPFRVYWFNDGLYILQADNKYAAATGGKITAIGNMTTAAALEALRPLVSYENEQGFKSNVAFFLTFPDFLKAQGIVNDADKIPVTYTKNGKTETVVFSPVDERINAGGYTGIVVPQGWTDSKKPGDTPLWQKEPASFRYMEYLPAEKTLYVRHSVTNDEGDKTIESFFNRMTEFIDKNDVQKLVLDIRMNGGGNNYLNKSIITAIIASKKINQKGKFFCITGRRTFSAAQNLTNELEKYTEVTFVGEPTGENVNFYGDTRAEVLPESKLTLNLSWLWWQNLDPRDKRKETAPELAADMSFSDYYNNIDPAMDLVLASGNKRAIEVELKSLTDLGKYEEATAAAREYINDPVHRYVSAGLEQKINNMGYALMGQNKLPEAGKLLQMNTELFPASANAYDSYAESLMRAGNDAEALKYYELAISKDTTGTVTQNSRNMIAKIKSK